MPVGVIRGKAVPLDLANVDTDRIIPARFLKRRRGPDYRDYLFHDDRFDAEGRPRPGFVLDDPAYRGARILVAAANFGVGSAREGAVWALQAFGFEAVLAASFGDVFRTNCAKNGLLTIALPAVALDGLRRTVIESPGAELEIDLPKQRVAGSHGTIFEFDVDAFEKRLLIEGKDEISLTLDYLSIIEAFERTYRPIPVGAGNARGTAPR